mmetsp:Transcript_68163/g.156422  ORF Transcript_68163/g.156422 Transcript_68163/m.156422 type:complete len:231 (-) Transcript_68163:36-728(-)
MPPRLVTALKLMLRCSRDDSIPMLRSDERWLQANVHEDTRTKCSRTPDSSPSSNLVKPQLLSGKWTTSRGSDSPARSRRNSTVTAGLRRVGCCVRIPPVAPVTSTDLPCAPTPSWPWGAWHIRPPPKTVKSSATHEYALHTEPVTGSSSTQVLYSVLRSQLVTSGTYLGSNVTCAWPPLYHRSSDAGHRPSSFRMLSSEQIPSVSDPVTSTGTLQEPNVATTSWTSRACS